MADLISRAAAIEAILGSFNAIRAIEELHAVDAVPVVHGRWIGVEYDGYADGYPVYDLYECSICGEEHKGEYDTLTNYCPNCGAKMDGDNKDGTD